MGSLSYGCAPCCYAVYLRAEVRGINLNPHSLKVPIVRQRRLLCVLTKSNHFSDRSFDLDPFSANKFTMANSVPSIKNLTRYNHASTKVLNANSDSYVLDGEDDGRVLSDQGQSLPKLLIPSVPDESKGEDVASISSGFWEWKPQLNVHFETSGSENLNSPAVLFLPGFGVGSFHYEKQLKDLGRDYRVWAIDFLGQGMSMSNKDPTRKTEILAKSEQGAMNFWGFGDESEPWANELVYSIDLWKEQVHYFIKEVIKEPVYLVGNSLGGYVALYVAACNPEMVKGITLLNATPFWGFLPNPARSPSISRFFPWSGTFPLPSRVRKLTEILWQKISDPKSIANILRQVYTDHTTKVDKVFSRIVDITEHPAAAASLASIMFAPRGQLSFKEALVGCQINNVPVCLMYGKEDPWVKPMWGFRVKRQLPEAPFYVISPAGHCPHDEVPEVVNFLLRGWIKSLESSGSVALPLLGGSESVDVDVARDLEFARETSKKVVSIEIYGSKSSFWSRFGSYLKSRFQVQEIKFS
ncbi:hypothetical protein Leryth_024629 [Lithospermum erythrorhizon]|nr:hypothetical protein Leryth_024629 [Lithospermum erythrorhizon]